jgi:hypothetical protein
MRVGNPAAQAEKLRTHVMVTVTELLPTLGRTLPLPPGGLTLLAVDAMVRPILRKGQL